MFKYVALFQSTNDPIDWEAEVIEAACWLSAREQADALKPYTHRCRVVYKAGYGLDLPLHRLIAQYYEYGLNLMQEPLHYHGAAAKQIEADRLG